MATNMSDTARLMMRRACGTAVLRLASASRDIALAVIANTPMIMESTVTGSERISSARRCMSMLENSSYAYASVRLSPGMSLMSNST